MVIFSDIVIVEEPVAASRAVHHIAGVDPEFLAQTGDVDIDQTGICELFPLPCRREYLLAREKAVARAQEQDEDGIFSGAERDVLTLDKESVGVYIESERAEFDEPTAGHRGHVAVAAEHRAHPGQHLAQREGAGDIVVGSGVESGYDIVLSITHRTEYHGHMGCSCGLP